MDVIFNIRKNFLPYNFFKSCAMKSPVPGLLTQIFLLLSLSPANIFLLDTTEANANFAVDCSCFTGTFFPGKALKISFDPFINSCNWIYLLKLKYQVLFFFYYL